MFCDPGPMVYGICFCPVSKKEELKNLKVAGNPVGHNSADGSQEECCSVFVGVML